MYELTQHEINHVSGAGETLDTIWNGVVTAADYGFYYSKLAVLVSAGMALGVLHVYSVAGYLEESKAAMLRTAGMIFGGQVAYYMWSNS